jgi:tRNA A-37 threonylcarbamoyl transferase component Bud32
MSETTPLALAGVRWWMGPGMDAERLRALVEAASAAMAAGALDRKGSRRKESFLLALEGRTPDYLLKVNHYGSLAPWRRLRRSKARAELARATALAARGIATPIPVAAGELRSKGLLERCYGLVRWLPDATDLLRVWTEARDGAASRRAWTRELGALVRRMHDAGVHQEDLAPNNFLWSENREPPLLAIDFERTRVGGRVAARARVFALAKLDRHFAGAPASARMRFLLAYANGSREEARRWWRDVAAFAPRLLRRDLAHWQRTAARPGRRFDVIELNAAGVAWRGFSRRGAPVERLRAQLATGVSSAPMRIAETALLCPIEVKTRREAVIAWGLAQTLHQRRLMAEPLALLHSSGVALLALADPEDLVALADMPAPERRAALAVAIDRLLGLGFDVARLRATGLAFSRRQRSVLLLDPTLCRLRRTATGSGRAAARAWVTTLLR